MNVIFPAEHITNVSFVVQWDEVVSQSVITYVLTWSDLAGHSETTTTHDTSYNVTGLTPITTYAVTVTARDQCGSGLTTAKIIATTYSDATSKFF